MLRSSIRRLAPAPRGPVIGVDLGTTYSCVALMEAGKPRVLENAEGFRTTPSYVGFKKDGEKLVGHAAKRQAVPNPRNTFYAVKRLIGRRFDDKKTQEDIKIMPYKIVNHNNGDAWVEDTNGKQFSPSQIGGFVLGKMKETAERHTGKTIYDAVVTVPAYFNDAQRQATKDAGAIAGLTVHRIINEPTAAALAFGIGDKASKKERAIAVYDLGGGTFDISVLDIAGGCFEVKATNGDTHLGGEDFDERVTKHLIQEFEAANPGTKISNSPAAIQRVREAAEKAKCELSSAQQTEINLPFLAMTADQQPMHLEKTLTRSKLEELTKDLVERSLAPCKRCLRDGDVNPDELAEVVLVGGQSRMPLVQAKVKELFGKEPYRGVNPDEAVAMGAAIQGGMLKGDVSGIVLLDVTPLSLGTRPADGTFARIIDKNTTIPCKKTRQFTTVTNMQSSVHFEVLQGEREMAADNQKLGEFVLDGIPPCPAGIPQIEVTFEIDVNGILHAVAKDKASGRAQTLVIHSKGGLSDSEVQQMIRDSERHAESDKKRRVLAEKRNKLEAGVTQARSYVGTWKHVPQEELEKVKGLADSAEKLLGNTSASVEDVITAETQLTEAISHCGGIEYKAQAAGKQ